MLKTALNAQVEKASEAIIAFEQEIDGPFASKLLSFVSIIRLTNFNQHMTEISLENNNAEQTAVFAHDTAILRTVLQNFRHIHVGENDFLATKDWSLVNFPIAIAMGYFFMPISILNIEF